MDDEQEELLQQYKQVKRITDVTVNAGINANQSIYQQNKMNMLQQQNTVTDTKHWQGSDGLLKKKTYSLGYAPQVVALTGTMNTKAVISKTVILQEDILYQLKPCEERHIQKRMYQGLVTDKLRSI